jgi:hypothetical protein
MRCWDRWSGHRRGTTEGSAAGGGRECLGIANRHLPHADVGCLAALVSDSIVLEKEDACHGHAALDWLTCWAGPVMAKRVLSGRSSLMTPWSCSVRARLSQRVPDVAPQAGGADQGDRGAVSPPRSSSASHHGGAAGG